MIKKISQALKEKRLFATLINNKYISKYLSYMLGLQYLIKNPAKGINIHIPKYKIPNEDEKELIERIFNSFIDTKPLWVNKNLEYTFLADL